MDQVNYQTLENQIATWERERRILTEERSIRRERKAEIVFFVGGVRSERERWGRVFFPTKRQNKNRNGITIPLFFEWNPYSLIWGNSYSPWNSHSFVYLWTKHRNKYSIGIIIPFRSSLHPTKHTLSCFYQVWISCFQPSLHLFPTFLMLSLVELIILACSWNAWLFFDTCMMLMLSDRYASLRDWFHLRCYLLILKWWNMDWNSIS